MHIAFSTSYHKAYWDHDPVPGLWWGPDRLAAWPPRGLHSSFPSDALGGRNRCGLVALRPQGGPFNRAQYRLSMTLHPQRSLAKDPDSSEVQPLLKRNIVERYKHRPSLPGMLLRTQLPGPAPGTQGFSAAIRTPKTVGPIRRNTQKGTLQESPDSHQPKEFMF